MTDPRQLLDAYAAEDSGGFQYGHVPVDRDEAAPKAFAALRAVIERHQAKPARANAARVGGRCILCDLGKPTRVVVENNREWHEHPSREPVCVECIDSDEYGDSHEVLWPCPTLRDITTALTCDDTA